MSRLRIVIVSASLAASWSLGAAWSQPINAPARDLKALAFLAGTWGVEDTIVELWLPPLRGLMVGVNRDPQGDALPFFEYLRIEARADGVFYIASPRGGGTTEFKLTELSAARVVFENPMHDFPRKIVYTRSGDRLEAEVGGDRNGEWRSFSLHWKRIACDAFDLQDSPLPTSGQP